MCYGGVLNGLCGGGGVCLSDPLLFKPNPKALVQKIENDGGDGDDAAGGGGGTGLGSGTGVYVPPKIQAADPDAATERAHRKRQEKVIARGKQSRMLKDLTRDLSDAPEMVDEPDGRSSAADDKQCMCDLSVCLTRPVRVSCSVDLTWMCVVCCVLWCGVLVVV